MRANWTAAITQYTLHGKIVGRNESTFSVAKYQHSVLHVANKRMPKCQLLGLKVEELCFKLSSKGPNVCEEFPFTLNYFVSTKTLPNVYGKSDIHVELYPCQIKFRGYDLTKDDRELLELLTRKSTPAHACKKLGIDKSTASPRLTRIRRRYEMTT